MTVQYTRNKESNKPYNHLLEAVVGLAVRDLHGVSDMNRKTANQFFRSDWFEELTGLDGKAVLEELEQREKNRKARKKQA